MWPAFDNLAVTNMRLENVRAMRKGQQKLCGCKPDRFLGLKRHRSSHHSENKHESQKGQRQGKTEEEKLEQVLQVRGTGGHDVKESKRET